MVQMSPFRLEGTAARLYEQVKSLPIYDYHCHLSPREIAEDRAFDNISPMLLSGDHYKWRAMRYLGVPEELVTGQGGDYEKFEAWMDTCSKMIGSPLYHWSVLEMQLFFGIDLLPSRENAPEIYRRCNEILRERKLSPRKLLEHCGVKMVCTTDDPADDLQWHRQLREEQDLSFSVLPAFRPDRALKIAASDFVSYIYSLGEAAGIHIRSYQEMLRALESRLDTFVELGCRFSDHSLESLADGMPDEEEAAAIFEARMAGEKLDQRHQDRYRLYTLRRLGGMYRRRGIVMQLHIGALRNCNSAALRALGPDTGYDIPNDFAVAEPLRTLLDAIESDGGMPRAIFYTLNPKDYPVLAALPHCYTEAGVRGKVQLGSAWWHNDTQQGMLDQLQILADFGLLSSFVGMLTDSRSFLSYARHDYFRRILCAFLGNLQDSGDYWGAREALAEMAADICCHNLENILK